MKSQFRHRSKNRGRPSGLHKSRPLYQRSFSTTPIHSHYKKTSLRAKQSGPTSRPLKPTSLLHQSRVLFSSSGSELDDMFDFQDSQDDSSALPPTTLSSTSSSSNLYHNDTIYSVISGMPDTTVGVSIIRVSGPDAFPTLALLTRRSLSTIKEALPRRISVRPLFRLDDQLSEYFPLLRTSSPSLHETQSVSAAETENSLKQHAARLMRDDLLFSSIPVAPTHRNSVLISEALLDIEAMIITFADSKSFTGEDTVEFHIHGNPLIIRETLAELSKLRALRHANRGEFLQRAFLNGRINLLQVDTYHDLLHAKDKQHLAAAMAHHAIQPELSAIFMTWRHHLVQSIAFLESIIDFGEDQGDIDQDEILRYVMPKLNILQRDIIRVLQRPSRAATHRRLDVAIFGSPNAGKSSLLNTLIGEQLAIVSAVPGTTRDIISTEIELDGIPLQLYDTAGLRQTSDIIEWEGIRRAKALAKRADLKIVLFDLLPLSQRLATLCKEFRIDTIDDWNNLYSPQTTPQQTLYQKHFRVTLAKILQDFFISQNNLVFDLLDSQTLVILTKADTLPFSVISRPIDLKAAETVDPLFLNPLTQQRAAHNAETHDELSKLEASLSTLLGVNNGSHQHNENTAQYSAHMRNAVFDDIMEQVERHELHSLRTNSRDGVITQLPFGNIITNTIRDCFHDSHFTHQPHPIDVANIMPVSSKFQYNIDKIGPSVREFMSQQVQKQRKETLQSLNISSNSSSSSSTGEMYDDDQLLPVDSEAAMARLLVKTNVTLNQRQREQILTCHNNIARFVSHFDVTSSSSHQQHQQQQQHRSSPKRTIRALPKPRQDLVLTTEYLRSALQALAEIDGHKDVNAEEILDVVFSRFCIGK